MTERLVLGIESSCDETAAAVVRGAPGRPGQVLSNAIFGQEDLHRQFGGVVPEIAARAHAERADLVIEHSQVSANDTEGRAHWDATYTFSATGRKVLN